MNLRQAWDILLLAGRCSMGTGIPEAYRQALLMTKPGGMYENEAEYQKVKYVGRLLQLR